MMTFERDSPSLEPAPALFPPVSPEPSDDNAPPLKRILYVDHTAKLGGGEIALLHLVQNLDRRRFTPIVVLSADGPLRKKMQASGIETHVLPMSASVLETRKDTLGVGTLLRLRDAARVWRYVWAMTRFIRANRIALVHTNSLKADILGGFAARLARIPLLWHVRDRIEDDYLPRPIVWLFRRLCHWLPDYIVANSQSTLETLTLSRQERSTAVYSGIEMASRVRVVHDGVQRTPKPVPVVYAGPYAAGLEAVTQPSECRCPQHRPGRSHQSVERPAHFLAGGGAGPVPLSPRLLPDHRGSAI